MERLAKTNKNKMLESLRNRLAKEKAEHSALFTRLREHLPLIIDIADEFNADKVVLFGSITDREKFTAHSDIDIGVTGVAKKDFFKLYAGLTDRIPRSIDLIDLDDDPAFKAMILEKGEIIYDRSRDNHH